MLATMPRSKRQDALPEERVTLRLPGDLHATLVHLADQEARSLNGQIIYMLRQQLRQTGTAPPPG